MQIGNLRAEPDALGGEILLTWTNPPDTSLSGIRILRREFTFPSVPGDLGSSLEIYTDAAAQPGANEQFLDKSGLKGETVYYYAVVAQDNTAASFPAFISAMATSPYASGEYLYKNLPGVYRTFDTATTLAATILASADTGKGQLQRFLEMFGFQFDLLRSFASGMRTFYDLRRIDAQLLPLLAQWIGWQTDFTLSVLKQRNDIQFASQFYRTTGIPASLRAVVSRIATWDTQIKEFAHSIFRAADPEHLSINEWKRAGGAWQPTEQVTMDSAYEGRPASLLAQDGRPLLVYHTREEAAGTVPANSHVYYKAREQDGWRPARALTSGKSINRWPSAVQRDDGSIWMFWAQHVPRGPRPVPQLKLQILAIGRGALPARVEGTNAGPFALAGGDQLSLVLTVAGVSIARTVTLRSESFANMVQVRSQDLAAVLDAELPHIDVRALADHVLFESHATGAAASLQILPSTVATKLGIATPVVVAGADARDAQLTSSVNEPFNLTAGDQLVLRGNGNILRTIRFETGQLIASLANATAAEVAATINAVVTNVANAQAGKILLTSHGGENALIAIDVSASSAAPKLGFGAPPPGLPAPQNQPFALVSGDQLTLRGNGDYAVTITFAESDFSRIAAAKAAEVAAGINAVVPGAAVVASGQLLLNAFARVDLSGTSVAGKLGLNGGPVKEPFPLAPGDQLMLRGDPSLLKTVTFAASGFVNITAARASEVANAMNAVLPGAAAVQGTSIALTPLLNADPLMGAAAMKLGLGELDDTEPSVFQDANKFLWLFWSSRRSGPWNIWYSRFDGAAWGPPKPLTVGALPDREPAAIFDSASGRIWVFWSRKKKDGQWNIFFRQTTKLDFNTLVSGDWNEAELEPPIGKPPVSYDSREPSPLLLAQDSLELYYASNTSNGWNTWIKALTSGAQGVNTRVTSEQFTRRAPSPLTTGPGEVRLWVRSNETQTYTSSVYPSARTIDARASGSITADTRNPSRLSFRRNIQDIQHYTYHATVANSSLTPDQVARLDQKRLYSRDTVGVYLVPDTDDEALTIRNQTLIAELLRKFLPIQVRAVFLIDQAFTEYVYDYAGAGKSAPLIDERMIDTVLSEGIGAVDDSHIDTGGFRFLRTWTGSQRSGAMPDATAHPPDVSFRLPTLGLEEEP